MSLDYFARLNGDSPFVDHELVDRACDLARRTGVDFVTNVCPRSFPYGVSVELFRTAVYALGYERMSEPEDFEHVTRYFYRHLADYRYRNIVNETGDLSGIRLTVDTPEDKHRIERLRAAAGDQWDEWGPRDAVCAYREMGL